MTAETAWKVAMQFAAVAGNPRPTSEFESAFAAAVEAEVAAMRARKDEAYEERNRVVAALARMFPSGTKRTDIPGWDAEWHGCVYIDTPAGQLSWHFHDSQAHLFEGLPPYAGEWDGHDTPEKYRRLSAAQSPAVEAEMGELREMLAECAPLIRLLQSQVYMGYEKQARIDALLSRMEGKP